MKAVFGRKIYTGNGDSIRDSYVIFDDNGGKIAGVKKERPESGCEIVGEFDAITPAFIDGHCHIGLDRAGEPYNEQDVNEHMDSLLFELNALDGILMDDKSFKESIEQGVLYSCIMPGSGNVVGGKSAVIKNYGSNTDTAFIKSAGIKIAVGYNPSSTDEWKGARPTTRMGTLALLRTALKKGVKIKGLVEKKKKIADEIEPHDEVVMQILNGEERLRVHAHKADDLIAIMRLKNEFNINVCIEHGSDVHSTEIFEQLKNNSIPIMYGPIDSFPYKVELKNESWRNVQYLIESGAEYGLITDHPVVLQRNLMLQLRFFRRFGLSKEECIKRITGSTAKILGIDSFAGSIERGKTASIVCWSGDPFNLDSYPDAVFAEGKKIL